jgi:hypothetical protein
MKRFLVVCFITPFLSLSQNVTIRGRAHDSYIGKVIKASLETDFITHFRQKEAADTISADGSFELAFHTDFIQPVFLDIGRVSAQLYIQPDFVYGITVPAVDDAKDYKNDAALPVNIGIIGADSTELNALIFDYQQQYAVLFDNADNSFLSRQKIFHRGDSLQKICDVRYAGIKNEYFRNYVRYSIASINASVSRGENYLINGYILKRPVLYNHYEYMNFFNACFKGYITAMGAHKRGQSVYHIINVKASYPLLSGFMREDKFLKTDTLRELVILRNMWDLYYSADFVPDAVENIVSQLHQSTRNSAHKKIAETMLASFNRMRPGDVAPPVVARTPKGTVGSLDNFRGRWVYINFFSTKNVSSLREMPKIAALKKQFGEKMIFLSICLDDSLKTYTDYLRANPKFDWPVWFNNEVSVTRKARDNYFVTGSEAYFLVNNYGYLAQSPALPPSAGIEYRLNGIFKMKKKNTKTGIR